MLKAIVIGCAICAGAGATAYWTKSTENAAALSSVGQNARPVHYLIGEDTGMIGAVWGIESCVEGLDRNWAYNPRCKMARP